ncbi:hypothetical protein A6769_16325 [Nostoc punctiforme NIES-2108]|uniref:Iron ABC transporter n=1 Tax=Nostoc punctiforme NIES-2108 TaxID=1356359 RepID=A0A367RLT8_NOSPU|nr:hypothetical protein A6769_16325 [Nostoc punctiforme NIES-2108]
MLSSLTFPVAGLIAPHIARQLVDGNHQGLIPVAVITGAMIVVLSDFIGRIIFAHIEITCVIVTMIGAPYCVYLLIQNL